jgi:hypothetical protein
MKTRLSLAITAVLISTFVHLQTTGSTDKVAFTQEALMPRLVQGYTGAKEAITLRQKEMRSARALRRTTMIGVLAASLGVGAQAPAVSPQESLAQENSRPRLEEESLPIRPTFAAVVAGELEVAKPEGLQNVLRKDYWISAGYNSAAADQAIEQIRQLLRSATLRLGDIGVPPAQMNDMLLGQALWWQLRGTQMIADVKNGAPSEKLDILLESYLPLLSSESFFWRFNRSKSKELFLLPMLDEALKELPNSAIGAGLSLQSMGEAFMPTNIDPASGNVLIPLRGFLQALSLRGYLLWFLVDTRGIAFNLYKEDSTRPPRVYDVDNQDAIVRFYKKLFESHPLDGFNALSPDLKTFVAITDNARVSGILVHYARTIRPLPDPRAQRIVEREFGDEPREQADQEIEEGIIDHELSHFWQSVVGHRLRKQHANFGLNKQEGRIRAMAEALQPLSSSDRFPSELTAYSIGIAFSPRPLYEIGQLSGFLAQDRASIIEARVTDYFLRDVIKKISRQYGGRTRQLGRRLSKQKAQLREDQILIWLDALLSAEKDTSLLRTRFRFAARAFYSENFVDAAGWPAKLPDVFRKKAESAASTPPFDELRWTPAKGVRLLSPLIARGA